MSYEPYKRGDAIRRQPPQAGHCLDCNPDSANAVVGLPGERLCRWHGCQPASAVDVLASIAARRA